MKDRVFIVHGWDGLPEHGWYLWLAKELEKIGVEAHVPTMPDTATPRVEAWIAALAAAVGTPDEHTFFVGHSIGCLTTLRYLETLPIDKKVGGAVLVAPWLILNYRSEEEKAIAKPWVETPLDFSDVRHHLPKSICLFSDNDADVPLENEPVFKSKLACQTEIHHAMGHFTQDDGVTELPEALEALKGLMV